MQEGLALSAAAEQIARFTVTLNLPHVSAHGLPASDLAAIFVRRAPANVVAAIPLEPTARIVRMNPSLGAPFRQGLTRINAEEIERAVTPPGCELGTCEPAPGKLFAAIGHVLAAEYAETKHLLRRQIGREFRIEVAADGSRQPIAVTLLHPVVDEDDALSHLS